MMRNHDFVLLIYVFTAESILIAYFLCKHVGLVLKYIGEDTGNLIIFLL